MEKKAISLIGVPLDLGAGCRGVDMGPSAIRRAGIATRLGRLGYLVRDAGNIEAPLAETLSGPGEPNARYLEEVVHVLEHLAREVRRHREAGRLPVVLGGDHSIALGTVSGMTGCAHRGGGYPLEQRLGLLWVDAHTDANTPETTPTGNLHGMPVAALFGRGPEALTRVGGFAAGAKRLEPQNAALIGVRSVDPAEAAVVEDLGVRVYTMEGGGSPGLRDRRGRGGRPRTRRGPTGCTSALDMDGLDPEIAPGVGTPVRGGLSYREAHALMEAVAESGGLRSLEVAEVNPIRDVRNQTAELAVELVASALGKRTLPRAARS